VTRPERPCNSIGRHQATPKPTRPRRGTPPSHGDAQPVQRHRQGSGFRAHGQNSGPRCRPRSRLRISRRSEPTSRTRPTGGHHPFAIQPLGTLPSGEWTLSQTHAEYLQGPGEASLNRGDLHRVIDSRRTRLARRAPRRPSRRNPLPAAATPHVHGVPPRGTPSPAMHATADQEPYSLVTAPAEHPATHSPSQASAEGVDWRLDNPERAALQAQRADGRAHLPEADAGDSLEGGAEVRRGRTSAHTPAGEWQGGVGSRRPRGVSRRTTSSD